MIQELARLRMEEASPIRTSCSSLIDSSLCDCDYPAATFYSSYQIMFFPAFLCLCTLLSSLHLVNTQSISLNGPILGPDFPTPLNVSTCPLLSDAQVSGIKLLSDSATTSSNDSALSISLFSVDEDALVFQYHHSPLVPPATGVVTVDAESVYRIGSCTKISTVRTFMIELGDGYFRKRVTRYVPELAAAAMQFGNHCVEFDEVDNVRWNDVTLGPSARHMAGIA